MLRKKLQPSWKSEQHNRCLRSCHASRWKSLTACQRISAIPGMSPDSADAQPVPEDQLAPEISFDFAEAASPAASPAPAPIEFAVKEQLAVEDELLEVFLEEAREVVVNGTTAIAALTEEPGNLSEQTTLRRAFHTLKGSSRMVGLNDFGEAAWAMEQLLNAWLAEQKPMQPPLLQLVRCAASI